MMKVDKWFTFKEVLDFYPAYAPTPNATNETNWFLSMLSTASLTLRYAGINLNGSIIKEADTKKYIEAVCNVIYDRQHDNYFYKVSCVDANYVLTEDDFKKAMNKFINVMNLTLPKYLPMIYEAEKSYENLLKQLESSSESYSRFNDTPQNEQDEVDFNTEAYATNMSKGKSVSKVDSGSPVDKMEALRTKWKSIILEWSNNFDMLFIDEYQLGG